MLAKSRAVRIKHIIASPNLMTEETGKLRDYFIALGSTEEGRKNLERNALHRFRGLR